jgi:hypothetical protein
MAMLHRYRDVMVVPSRDMHSGGVEVEEMFIGGRQGTGQPWPPGGRSPYRDPAGHGEPRHMRAMAW